MWVLVCELWREGKNVPKCVCAHLPACTYVPGCTFANNSIENGSGGGLYLEYGPGSSVTSSPVSLDGERVARTGRSGSRWLGSCSVAVVLSDASELKMVCRWVLCIASVLRQSAALT